MLPQIRTEFRKIATVRSPWLLLAAGPVIVVAGITGLVQSGANVHDPAVQNRALAHVGLAAVITLIFGILAVAGEYRHGTITDTFLSFPGRGRVIAAKLASGGVEHVEHVDRCTSCEPELYFSHRRDNGVTGRQAGIIVRDGS